MKKGNWSVPGNAQRCAAKWMLVRVARYEYYEERFDE